MQIIGNNNEFFSQKNKMITHLLRILKTISIEQYLLIKYDLLSLWLHQPWAFSSYYNLIYFLFQKKSMPNIIKNNLLKDINIEYNIFKFEEVFQLLNKYIRLNFPNINLSQLDILKIKRVKNPWNWIRILDYHFPQEQKTLVNIDISWYQTLLIYYHCK